MSLTARAELTARPGRRDDFVLVAKALAAAAADEPGTLRYDWFEDADPAKFVVIEQYVDSAAAFAHNAHCEELLANLTDVAEMTSVHLHGDITPDLQAFAASLPIVKTFSPLT
jgi:quinol monooxygenase YgiN